MIAAHINDAFVAAWQFQGLEKGELSLEVGNLLVVLQRGDEWWKGVNVSRGKKGWFPATSVRPASAAERDLLRDALDQLRAGRSRNKSVRQQKKPTDKPPVPTSAVPTSSAASVAADGSPQMRRAATSAIAVPPAGGAVLTSNQSQLSVSPTILRSPARAVASGLSPLVAHRAPPAPPGATRANSSGAGGVVQSPVSASPPVASSPPVSSQRLIVMGDEAQLTTLPDDDSDEDVYSSIPSAGPPVAPTAAARTPAPAATAATAPPVAAPSSAAATTTSVARSIDADEEYPVPLNELVMPSMLRATTTASRDSSTVYKPITPLAPPSATKVNYHTLPDEEQMLAELQRQEAAKAASPAPPAQLQRKPSDMSHATRSQMFQRLVTSEMTQKPWFDNSLTRELAIQVLTGQPIGTYVVRPSTRPSCLALSHIESDGVTVGHGILHHWDGPERIGWSIENQPETYATLDDLLRSLPLRHDDMILKRVSLDALRAAAGLPAATAVAPSAHGAAPKSPALAKAGGGPGMPIVAVPLASLPKPDAALAAGVYGSDGGEQARMLSRSHSLMLKAMAETGTVQGGTNVTTGRRLQPMRALSHEDVDPAAPKQLLQHASNRALALLAKTPCAPLPPPMDGEQYRVAPWFHSDLTRQKAIDVLTGKANGAFVVRPSSQPGCLSLSHVHPNGAIGHGIIHRWPKPGALPEVRKGWSIENEPQTYGTLAQLLESLPLKHGLIEPELVTDEELAAVIAANAAPATPQQVAQPAPKVMSPRSPRSLPVSDSQYVIKLAAATETVARNLHTTKSVANALVAGASERNTPAAEPPASLPLTSMQGKFAAFYAECAVEYRGADLRFELPLRPGERVAVSDATSAGWWYGRLLGSTRCGWFLCTAVRWFPETLDLFVQSIGFGLDVYRALLANGIATVRQLQGAVDIFAVNSQVPGLTSEQQQAILRALTERNGDSPMHLPAPQPPPPAVLSSVPQPVPYVGNDEFIALTARELGGLQTRIILCVAVPAVHAYWIDCFDSRDRVSRLLADTCRRLTTQLDGLLDVFVLEANGERRLEPQVPLAEYQLRGMSQIVIRQRV